ncbi:MAG: SDR family oxidoreductase [Armatimonadota bacterium]|nr:SDR family oxidoreductase [Armatimonadota bacterium]
MPDRSRIVVTGGHGYLGAAVMERLSRDGEAITVDEKEVDLADFAATKAWAESVGKPVHGLVALAGGFRMKQLGDLGEKHYVETLGINSRTAFSTLDAFAHELADGSSVVLVGSQAYSGAKDMSVYAASKAAVVSLARSASLEWKQRGIRVNAILPDTIDTPANRKSMPNANFDAWQKPAEIAEVIAFLLSESASIISGNAIALGRQ